MTERDKRRLMGALGVAFVVAALLVARGSCQGPAPSPSGSLGSGSLGSGSPPPASAETASAPTASAPVVVLPTYEVDDESSSVVLTGGRKGKGRFRARFTELSGTWRLNGNQIAGSAFELDIQSRSLQAPDEDLEAQLKSPELLEVERYPKTTFVSTRFEEKTGADGSPSHELAGNLSLHGVLKHVEVPATIAVSDEAARIDFELTLSRGDFGIQAGPDDSLDNALVLELHLELRRAPDR